MAPKKKSCGKCGQTKSVDEFYKTDSICKECKKKYNHEKYMTKKMERMSVPNMDQNIDDLIKRKLDTNKYIKRIDELEKKVKTLENLFKNAMSLRPAVLMKDAAAIQRMSLSEEEIS